MSNYRATGPVSTLVVAFGGRVFGLQPGTGGVLWEQQVDPMMQSLTLLVTETAIYAAGYAKLACLHYPSGGVVWSVDTHWSGRSSLLLEGDRILVAKAGTVECYSLTGERLWSNGFKGKGQGAVAMGIPGATVQADDNT